MQCIDYGRSFITTAGPGNAPRFWVESRCRIVDEQDQSCIDYYQCGSCKSEHTFAPSGLMKDPNYDFLPVFGPNDSVVFHIFLACDSDVYDTVIDHDEREPWGGIRLDGVREAEPLERLDTNEQILDATDKCLPIVAQTCIRDASTRMRAIIECPVKTMNMDRDKCIYQVDTGPVLFPDLTQRCGPKKATTLDLAFVAFNVPHFADFVIQRRTPVVVDGKEVCKCMHYSEVISLEARNTLFAIGQL